MRAVMNNLILMIALIAIVIGLVLGILVVWIICLQQRYQSVDSLVRAKHIVGRSGTVEVPFNSSTAGKVRVNVKGSMVDFVAFTDESREFNPGDRIFVVGMKKNKVWVVSEESIASQ
jgi:membrane protein implicated in regulation of membrane protease activity